MKIITSKQNHFVKYLLHLQEKSSFRRKEKKFVVEGQRELRLALAGGYRFEAILFEPNLFCLEKLKGLMDEYHCSAQLIQISSEVYQRLAYRGSTEGVIGLGYWKDHSLNNLKLSTNPLILIAENIEKPGNIGAMLRTADAAALDAFIIANPITDLYNPNIIRSSVGGIFTVQIAIASTSEVLDYMKKQKISVYAATLQDSLPYYEQNYRQACAIAVGSEANGLSKEIRQASVQNILIPMEGKLDSLNVSVSAAILIFEAKRQRKTS